MKKVLLFVLFFTSILSYTFSQDKKEEENLDIYTITVGFNLKMLKVNDIEFFNFYSSDVSATVLEITPIDETTCKTVISVPWNRAGSFQNYVIYLKTGDLLQTRTGTQVAVGLVGNFKYNILPFVGIAK